MDEIISSSRLGDELSYSVRRGPREIDVVIPVSLFTEKDYRTIFSLFMVAGLGFLASGLIVFHLKPRSPASWAWLFFCATVGIVFASVPEYCTNHRNIIQLVLWPLVGPSLLLLSLHFPVEVEHRGMLARALLLATPAVALFYFVSFWTDVSHFIIANSVFLTHFALCAAYGVFLMCRSFLHAPDPVTAQKGKVVLLGFVVFVAGTLIGLFGTFVLQTMNVYHYYWLFPAVFMLPGCVGYAIVKHNVFDVDLLIRRSVTYFLVTSTVVALFFVLIGVLSIGLQYVTGQSSQIAAVVTTLLLVTIARPLRDRVDGIVDRRFFREKYEYRATIQTTAVSIVNARKVEESRVARFLSPKLAKAMIHGYEELTRIKRKRLTVVFTDIRGFTTLADTIEAEETIEILNRYLSEMTALIHEYDGTLDKFMGDGIMVVFGDPLDQEDHAARAVKMAVAMQERMGALGSEWSEDGRRPLSIGIGINTGHVTVGGIGSEHHLDYTAIGREVNLAARLESVAAGGEILISHATYAENGELATVEDRGEVTVKGLAKPVKVYRVDGLKSCP